MRSITPTQILLCCIITLSTLNRSACGFSLPSRISSQYRHDAMELHAATLDRSIFFDDSTNSYQSTSIEQQSNKSRTQFLTATIAAYIALFLQKLTWDTLGVDCTADVLQASCRKLHLPNSMALGTAFLSLCAAMKMMIGSSFLSFSSLTAWYLKRLELTPLITKCITGGLIAFMGDYGAQWFEYKSEERKRRRIIKTTDDTSTISLVSDLITSPRAGDLQERIQERSRLSIYGNYNFRRGVARFLECLLISSPLMHYGYDLFERIIPTTTTAASGVYSCLAALSHVVADSVFLDGIFVMTGIIATGLLEGNSLKKVLPNLRNVYVPTLKASVVTSSALMPLQFLSFRFLPVQLRVLSVNAVDLIWTGVVSFVSHSDSHREIGKAVSA